jgi:hypothetical protein
MISAGANAEPQCRATQLERAARGLQSPGARGAEARAAGAGRGRRKWRLVAGRGESGGGARRLSYPWPSAAAEGAPGARFAEGEGGGRERAAASVVVVAGRGRSEGGGGARGWARRRPERQRRAWRGIKE